MINIAHADNELLRLCSSSDPADVAACQEYLAQPPVINQQPPATSGQSDAATTVCARVVIEIKQELTLERQAFDAEMKIHNTLVGIPLTDVGVEVKFMDESGLAVIATSDPNDTNARFFIRIANQDNISNVSGMGTVAGGSTATINWLIIPAPGAAGTTPLGKKYLVGAKLTYKLGGELQTLEVTPDVITVKPMPQLALDYFLTRDVEGDDPLTAQIESVVPFNLGVRVKNSGLAAAKALKIDSAQPRIIDNAQGLLINFQLTGSFLDDLPAENTLLINFGDINPGKAKMGRWIMESSLSGRFTDFSARFSHADELGGVLTSLIQSANAHLLLRDVRVDQAGRDYVRDFLAEDSNGLLKVYESDAADSSVTNLSAQATLSANGSGSGVAVYQFNAPPASGFFYIKKPDPFNGAKALGTITRADNKVIAPENIWLSRTRNKDSKEWEYWISLFDFDSPGVYRTEFVEPPTPDAPPQIGFTADRTVKEGERVSFLVQASGTGGTPSLSGAPLPTGATFSTQSPQAKLVDGIFDWTPAKGQAGNYLIVFTASEGGRSSSRAMMITVQTAEPPPGPGTPVLVSPAIGEQVATLRPTFIVRHGTHPQDPTTSIRFEVFTDEAHTTLAAYGSVAKGTTVGEAGTTSWTMQDSVNLVDNTRYWWRAIASDGGEQASQWVNGEIFVNLYNDAPAGLSLLAPQHNSEVASTTPTLVVQNAHDADGDAITYSFAVYADEALTQRVAGVSGLVPGADGSTAWTVDVPLQNHVRYYWQAEAQDALAAITRTYAQSFLVNTQNTAPTAPVLLSPQNDEELAMLATTLTAQASDDAEADPVTYVIELDTVNTFDSLQYQVSPSLTASGQQVAWSVANLLDNTRYYWRVTAADGRTTTTSATSRFFVNQFNDIPGTPVTGNPAQDSWVSTVTPQLESFPVSDADGDTIMYRYAVYADEALTQTAFTQITTETQLTLDTALADHKPYFWRVRAEDGRGGNSDWSAASRFYVSSNGYTDPTLAFTAPSGIQYVDLNKQAALTWQADAPNVDATVSLYYDTTGDGYAGTPIVEGLTQAYGSTSGSFTWDVSALPVGTYYVYGLIRDPRGAQQSYAAGALVISPEAQKGGILVTMANAAPVTSEGGATTTLRAVLTKAPTADVKFGVSSSNLAEGTVSPASLTFTPGNWSIPQFITATGVEDCIGDGSQSYDINLSKGRSLDPEYNQVDGPMLTLTNLDNENGPNTDNSNFGVCHARVEKSVFSKKTGRYEHDISVEVSNVGPTTRGVTLVPLSLPAGWQQVNSGISLNTVRSNTTVRTNATLTVSTSTPTLTLPSDWMWHVELTP